MDFQTLRDQWAVKAPTPSHEEVEMQASIDRNANPHNEPYHNKRPRRSTREIHSDLAYRYSDVVLHTQYGALYTDWLMANGYENRWDFWRKKGHRDFNF